MKLKQIVLSIILSFSMLFALNINDLRAIQGVNPTPRELNSYILKKCKETNIPPIIVKAILLKEGLNNHKWQQYSPESGYGHDTIVYHHDAVGSYGLGLFQITYHLNNGNENEIKRVVSDWKFNVDKAFEKLLTKWKKNIGSMTGIDTNPLIIENWYYPIAWYNGEGSAAKRYVDFVYSYMKDKNRVSLALGNSRNRGIIIDYYKTIPNISAPYIIDGFRGDDIRGYHPQPYTLQQILDNGGELHIWDKSSNSYKIYDDNGNSGSNTNGITSTEGGYYAPFSGTKYILQGWKGKTSHGGHNPPYPYALDIVDKVSGTKFDVLSVKNGKVTDTGWDNGFGYYIIIKHDDGLYSEYAHLSERYVTKNETVQRGKVIGKSGGTGSYAKGGVHLHIQFSTDGTRGDMGNTPNSRMVNFVEFPISKVQYIDTSKRIYPFTSQNTLVSNKESIVDGAGSLIRPEILNTSDKYKCQWGCYRDEADMQVHSSNPSTVSFQWKATNNCKKLKIGVMASDAYRKKYHTWINPHEPLKVKIYTKAWDNEVVSEAFKTTLPKTVDYVDGWNNIIVTSQQPLSKVQKIIAECTENDDGKDVTMLDETSIELPLSYKFGGQSSVIRDSNKDYNKQVDGIYQDVAIGLSDNKAMTLFQWQTSSNCKSLVLKSGHYPNGNGVSTSVNGINIKSWNDSSWSSTSCNNRLPCTIKAPSNHNGKYGDYYIIKVKTNANTLDGNRISAVCKE